MKLGKENKWIKRLLTSRDGQSIKLGIMLSTIPKEEFSDRIALYSNPQTLIHNSIVFPDKVVVIGNTMKEFNLYIPNFQI